MDAKQLFVFENGRMVASYLLKEAPSSSDIDRLMLLAGKKNLSIYLDEYPEVHSYASVYNKLGEL